MSIAINPGAETRAVALATCEGNVTPAKLAEDTGCLRSHACSVLSRLAAKGALIAAAHGVYVLAASKRRGDINTAGVNMHRSERDTFAKRLREAEEWFASTEQWPGGPTGLPPARPPVFRERGVRHG
jgi:hypothetical protein